MRAWRDQRPHPGLGMVLEPGVVVRDLAHVPSPLGCGGHHRGGRLLPRPGAGARQRVGGHASPHATWVLATKGWQEDTPAHSVRTAPRMSVGRPAGHPGRAGAGGEVAAGLPTAFLFASHDADARRLAARTFASPSILTVTTSDVIGAETASAYKNVAAIAVGIAEGLSKRFARDGAPEMFANARAAMFAQGMIDIVRLAEARGGRAATVLGLAGAGDLYVTCVGGRNGRFGRLLGSGTTMDEALRIINSTVEGISNTRAALGLADRYSVDLRTARTVDFALHHHLIGDEAVQAIRDLFTATMTSHRTDDAADVSAPTRSAGAGSCGACRVRLVAGHRGRSRGAARAAGSRRPRWRGEDGRWTGPPRCMVQCGATERSGPRSTSSGGRGRRPAKASWLGSARSRAGRVRRPRRRLCDHRPPVPPVAIGVGSDRPAGGDRRDHILLSRVLHPPERLQRSHPGASPRSFLSRKCAA